MNDGRAVELLDSAWRARRASFDLPEEEQRAALASVRGDLHRAAEMLRGTGQPVHYANALHFGAHVAMDVGDMEAAEERWLEAVEVLRSSGEPLQLAHKIRHLGDLEMARGRLVEADRHYGEAWALYLGHSDQRDLDFANLVRRMATLAEKRGQEARARAWWLGARELYAELGLPEGVAEAEERLGEVAG